MEIWQPPSICRFSYIETPFYRGCCLDFSLNAVLPCDYSHFKRESAAWRNICKYDCVAGNLGRTFLYIVADVEAAVRDCVQFHAFRADLDVRQAGEEDALPTPCRKRVGDFMFSSCTVPLYLASPSPLSVIWPCALLPLCWPVRCLRRGRSPQEQRLPPRLYACQPCRSIRL